MHRNVTIVVIVLIFVVIIAYLIWLRSKIDQPNLLQDVVNTQTENVITPAPKAISTQSASPSATKEATSSGASVIKEATASAKPKSATPSSTKK